LYGVGSGREAGGEGGEEGGYEAGLVTRPASSVCSVGWERLPEVWGPPWQLRVKFRTCYMVLKQNTTDTVTNTCEEVKSRGYYDVVWCGVISASWIVNRVILQVSKVWERN
jgi:hypothetical protein